MNFADVLEAIAKVQPDVIAQTQAQTQSQVQGTRRFTWADFDRRTTALARCLLAAGAARQDKVAQYLYNCPEYFESVVAACKASLVPVNTNYRYLDSELLYLWDNADVVAVAFHGCFTERIAGIRDRLPRIRTWLWVDDASGPCPEWAMAYEAIAASKPTHQEPLALQWSRSPDDLTLIYTGGTTGMPKGVMWRQGDFFQIFNRDRHPRPFDTSGGAAGIGEQIRTQGPGRTMLPACPQMHALGFLGSITALLGGGKLVTLGARRFDPVETWETVEREGVEQLYIVGDAFARPLLDALDREPGRFCLDSLKLVRSSGVMWSEQVKRGLLRHHPGMVLRDGLGSTESVGMGRSESTGTQTSATATFLPGPFTRVLTDDLRPVVPGSGEVGTIAVGGPNPVGYYKDPQKTAATFKTIDGVLYSLAGDFATVEADGSIRLLGRGSVCINTGGEKVFPEEVEEALKLHPAVRDAVCVGVPDERLGERIVGVVELCSPDNAPSSGRLAPERSAELVAHVKARLAHYKAPRQVLAIESVGRAANGKVDYQRLRAWAKEQLLEETPRKA